MLNSEIGVNLRVVVLQVVPCFVLGSSDVAGNLLLSVGGGGRFDDLNRDRFEVINKCVFGNHREEAM